MNHFSLEVMGKQNQKKLLDEELREQAVRGYRRKFRLPLGRMFGIVVTILLMYFWLFV